MSNEMSWTWRISSHRGFELPKCRIDCCHYRTFFNHDLRDRAFVRQDQTSVKEEQRGVRMSLRWGLRDIARADVGLPLSAGY